MHVSLNRRQLLQAGGLSMLGLGLPAMLQARDPSLSGGKRRGPEKSCIFICQYGGMSHLDTFDLKPDAAAEIKGPYKPIATSVPGVQVGELLPQLARQTHRYCIIRSMSHDNTGHDSGMHCCMTGHSRPKENTPYFGSVVAKLQPARRNVPSYVWLQNLAGDVKPLYLNGGFLGPVCAPLVVGKDDDNASRPTFRMTSFDPPADVSPDRLRHRQQLLAEVETAGATPVQAGSARTMRSFQERAVELVTGPAARQAFDLEREPVGLRDRYGRNPFGQNLLLSRRLVEAGVRLVTVNAWVGYPAGEKFVHTQGWDMHGQDNCGIFSNGRYGLGFVLPRFDQAVAALLEDLEVRGLLESTLVVALGEFGRSPRIRIDGGDRSAPGRDHWSNCFTALAAGGGIKGGQVYGASDRTGAYPRDNPVRPEDFAATLYHALGIAPQTRLSPDGATLPVSTGEPITALFG